MKKYNLGKRILSFILTFCMLVANVFGTSGITAQAAEEPATTTINFYNSDGWESVYAYFYANEQPIEKVWPGDVATPNSDLGEGWYTATIERDAVTEPFNVIFNNNSGIQTGSYYITRNDNNYSSMTGNHNSKAMAKFSVSGDEGTTIYFYNSEKWEQVNTYAYNVTPTDVFGAWPGTPMTIIDEDNDGNADEGWENWVKVTSPITPSANVMFLNAAKDSENIDVWWTDSTAIYMGMDQVAYTSKEAAEAANPLKTDEVISGDGNDKEVTETTLYFYDADNLGAAYAHCYYNAGNGDVTITGQWPGAQMEPASELGTNWYKVNVEHDAVAQPLNVIFNSGSGTQFPARVISKTTDNYCTKEGAFPNQSMAEASVSEDGTVIYFQNTEGWNDVNVYAYGTTPAEAFGGWPGTKATIIDKDYDGKADEGWEDWVKIVSPVAPPFSVIFSNPENPDNDRAELYLPNSEKLYVTASGTTYATKEEAEEGVTTTLYFYKTDDWSKVYAHCYYNNGTGDVNITGGWPGAEMKASELGENWYEVAIKYDASKTPFTVIFNGYSEGQLGGMVVTKTTGNYCTKDGIYNSQIMAEFSVSGEEGTSIYFYNSGEWDIVNAYAYETKPGEAFGGWPGTQTTIVDEDEDGEADEGWEDWVKIVSPVAPPFNVIFSNPENPDNDRAEVLLEDANHVYVAMNNKVYTSKDELINALESEEAEIYFINSENWENVYAYPCDGEGNAIGEAKPGYKMEEDETVGELWYKVTVPETALLNPFQIVFGNGEEGNAAAETEMFAVTRNKDNYASIKGIYKSKSEAENSVGLGKKTAVYFLNNLDWAESGVYVYGAGEALGPWGGLTLTDEHIYATTAIGGKTWYKVEVPAEPKFSVIYYNEANDKERTELQIQNTTQVWVTGSKAVYGSQEEAELAEGLGDPSKMTTVYFYNHRGWGDINGYAFVDSESGGITIGAGWPGKAATKEPELGDNWWSHVVPREATEETPFSVIFNDGVNQTPDTEISNKTKVYVIADGTVYDSVEAAEEAAAKAVFEDGCESGANKDSEEYYVNYSGAGANLPYVTYEAENAVTNGTVLNDVRSYREVIQSEASGRRAVELDAEGEYVEFTLSEAANSIVLRYSIPDSADGKGLDASLSLYVDGTEKQDLALTSKYAWVYGSYPYSNNPKDDNDANTATATNHRFFDEVRVLFDTEMPAGTKIKLQKDAADTAANYVIDFVDCELVGPALTQPENSLSVTDFGATPDDDTDDAQAFRDCIAAAEEAGKEVWIPAGTFVLSEEEALEVHAVTIRGAGMWYTNLVGAGVSFHYSGTCKFYDFAMTGVSTIRDDGGDLAGFEGAKRATNVTIQNIWMEHIKVGVWSANTDGLAILGCRIRNTYADGINMCSATTNALVENNNVRNTGDDAIAIWPWLADCGNNTIRHNTIMAPNLANGIAIYGGHGHVVENNYVSDIINNGSGICLASEFATAKGYSGTITVKNNVLERCGSYQTDKKYPIGAIWVWVTVGQMKAEYNIKNNTILDSSYSAFLIDAGNEVSGVNILNNTVDGATDVIHIRGTATGSAKVAGNVATDYTGKFINNENSNFALTEEVAISGTYGQKVSEMTVTGTSTSEGTWKVDTTAENANDIPEVGTKNAYKVICVDADGNTISEAEAIPIVEPKAVVVTINDVAKVYGEENPAFTFAHKAEDLVGDDTVADLAVTLTSRVTKESNAGTYAITGTSAGKNYDVTVVPGIFTVNKAKTVISIEKGKNYYSKFTDDADFALEGITANREGAFTYKVTEGEGVVSVSTEGNITILGSGSAVVKASMEESKNYLAAESQPITITVQVKEGFSVRGMKDAVYTGNAIKPEPEVYFELTGKKLAKGKDYTITYKNNKDVYTLEEDDEDFDKAKAPQLIIKGKGNYEGTLTVYFRIDPKNLAAKDVTVTYTDAFIETGKKLKPLSKITVGGKKLKTSDYSVEYFAVDSEGKASETATDVKEVGTYKMVITGKYDETSNKTGYDGKVEKEVKVYSKEGNTYLKNMVITIEGKKSYSTEYTGAEIRPAVAVAPKGKNQEAVSAENYIVEYDNNVLVGTATIIITGKPEAGIIGTVTKTFKITGTKLNSVAKVNEDANWKKEIPYDVKARAAVQAVDENGRNLVTLTDKKGGTTTFTEDVDYKVSYKKNDKPGTATMVFTGIGKYTGTVTKTFKVTKLSLNDVSVTCDTEVIYLKKGAKAKVGLTYDGVLLEESKDYKVTYKGNKTVTDKATAVITGIGAFSGKVTKEFKVKESDLETNVAISVVNKAYQDKKGGYKVVPVLTDAERTRLANNKDFTCEYYLVTEEGETLLGNKDIVEANSKVKVLVNAKGKNFTGTTYAVYNVTPQDISKADISVKAQVYTGNKITLVEDDFITDLKLGTDYEIVGDYENNINKGTASVTIKGIGNYGGTKKVTFKITSRTLAWWWNLIH